MNNIKYSIIVPCFNAESFIGKTIVAFENQDFDKEKFEVILVDDFSKDKTYEVLLEIKDKSNLNITVLKNTMNMGPGLSRKKAAEAAKGKYLCFCDSDDWYENDFLQKVDMEQVESDSDIIAVDMNYVLNNKKMLNDMTSKFVKGDKKTYIANCGESLCNLVVLKRIFVDTKPIDIRHGEDIALVPVMFMNARKISHISEPLYNYYVREGSASAHYSKDAYNEMIEAFKYIKDNTKGYEECIEYIGVKTVVYNATVMAIKSGNKTKDIKNAFLNDFVREYPDYCKNIYVREMKFYKRWFVSWIQNNHWLLARMFVFVHGKVLGS